MTLSQRLRTYAKHTGLDAVIELLQEAADEIDALQARALLALRPAAVPMTPASRDVIMATRTANADADEWPEPWAYQRGWNNAEAHHGISAQAKKETP